MLCHVRTDNVVHLYWATTRKRDSPQSIERATATNRQAVQPPGKKRFKRGPSLRQTECVSRHDGFLQLSFVVWSVRQALPSMINLELVMSKVNRST